MVSLSNILNFKNGAQSVLSAAGAEKGAQVAASTESKPVPSTAIKPPRLDGGPMNTFQKENTIPEKLSPIGEKPKTIVDESFQEAMSRGKYTPAQWLSENAKAAKDGKREPLSIAEYVEVLRDGSNLNETPEERKKREKRENLAKAFSTFGNIAANIANFAFATQGGIPGDYNNKAATEREKAIEDKRQKLKEKYDEILLNATGDDITYARNLQLAKEKAAADKEIKDREFQFKVSEANAKKARQAAIDKENKRKNDAQIKKWESDAKNNGKRANAYANRKANDGAKNDNKYAASFIGANGTYRFKDKDIASAVASSATAMLKKLAGERGDEDTVDAIVDAMAELKSAPAALEFVRQRLANYPEVEAFIAERAIEYQPNGVGGKKNIKGFDGKENRKEKPKGW
jgi:hypothetical protein